MINISNLLHTIFGVRPLTQVITVENTTCCSHNHNFVYVNGMFVSSGEQNTQNIIHRFSFFSLLYRKREKRSILLV